MGYWEQIGASQKERESLAPWRRRLDDLWAWLVLLGLPALLIAGTWVAVRFW